MELPAEFDINGPGVPGKLFGLPFDPESASVIVIPVPWEVTVSYGSGTSFAPEAILRASFQVDLALKDFSENEVLGISMLSEISGIIAQKNSAFRELAKKHISDVEAHRNETDSDDLKKINEASEELNDLVKTEAQKWIGKNKLIGLLGGDHSTSIGLIRALSEKHERFGILQIDAHCDLRKAYEGFIYSHASAMFNVLKLPAVSRLVQVGIRDYCEEELTMINRGMGRIKTFFDQDLKEHLIHGKTWDYVSDLIIKELPALVYISFDIDGLDPKLCPHTGTPVPGGLEFEQAVYLIKKLVRSGKKIIGFDLCEVVPGNTEWDANVGARALYQLCHWMAASRGTGKHKA